MSGLWFCWLFNIFKDISRRNYLTGKPQYWYQLDKKYSERKMLFEIRKRAQQAMDDLIFIMSKIKNVSNQPEKQFALIFNDEKRYFTMLQILQNAYEESYRSHLKLIKPENLDVIQAACLAAFQKTPSKKQLTDRHRRNEILTKLKKKETEDGISYYESMRNRILLNRGHEAYRDFLMRKLKDTKYINNEKLKRRI